MKLGLALGELGEMVGFYSRKVGRKKAQEAQKSDFVTETTKLGRRVGRRRIGRKTDFYRRKRRERRLVFYPRYPRDPR